MCEKLSNLWQRAAAVFLLSVTVVGCSGSSDDSPNGASTVDNAVANDNATNTTISSDGAVEPVTTRVTFEITVPAYSSNALQVRLAWGDKNHNASWVTDESWSITDDFPGQTLHPLTVSFSDDNGGITLATYTTDFQTDAVESQIVRISRDQFESEQWDTDGDGVSNLAESIAGTNVLGDDVPDPVQATLELVPDKTFRLTWQRSSAAQFYRVLENPDGNSGFTQVGDDLSASSLFYDHRVALYKRVNASYIVQACNDLGCSDSAMQTVPGSLEAAITYVKASNAEVLDVFGVAVALTADGNMLAVGASGEDSAATQINGNQRDNELAQSGAVYIFDRVDGSWLQKDYLKASNAQAGDGFGAAIGISGDGNTLAVGAPYEDSWILDLNDNSTWDTSFGSVYIFTRTNGEWLQQSYLKPESYIYRGQFGRVMSLSADGNTLAVGVAIHGTNSGSAFVFVRSGDSWEEQATIKASNRDIGRSDEDGYIQGGDQFGSAVSLSADGNTLAVGAPYEDSAATGINGDQTSNLLLGAGAVYTFTRSGSNWQQQTYIKPSNAQRLGSFGIAISLASDGSTLAVNASGEQSLYLFSQSGGSWLQQARIAANKDESEFDYLMSHSFSDDGTTLAVGSTVYVYKDATWQLQRDLQSISGSDKVYNGRAVISGDGNTIAIGDLNDESSAAGLNGNRYDYFGYRSGAVYLY